ncbi:MAG: hypothetical protein U0359_34095 [Byssovorax sp.]
MSLSFFQSLTAAALLDAARAGARAWKKEAASCLRGTFAHQPGFSACTQIARKLGNPVDSEGGG